MDNYKKKAKFINVKHDMDAVKYHAIRYKFGSRYPLAEQCWLYLRNLDERVQTEIILQVLEEDYGVSNTKP